MGVKERCRIMARKYKKNRVSRKGKTSYDIYLEKRAKLEDEGFALRAQLTKDEFYDLRESAKKIGDTNFMRNLTNSERFTDKPTFYRMKRELREMETEDEDVKRWKKNLLDKDFEWFKGWTNDDWTRFRDDFTSNGGTWEEFRGIYGD